MTSWLRATKGMREKGDAMTNSRRERERRKKLHIASSGASRRARLLRIIAAAPVTMNSDPAEIAMLESELRDAVRAKVTTGRSKLSKPAADQARRRKSS